MSHKSTDTRVYRGGKSLDYIPMVHQDVSYSLDGLDIRVSFGLGTPWRGTSIVLNIGPEDQAALLGLLGVHVDQSRFQLLIGKENCIVVQCEHRGGTIVNEVCLADLFQAAAEGNPEWFADKAGPELQRALKKAMKTAREG